MSFNGNPTRIWDRNTPADGDLFQAEFLRIYNNFNNIKAQANTLQAIQKGLALGYLQVTTSNPNVITVPKWNVYEVKNKLIQIPNSLSLDFGALANIFRSDGVTPISSTTEIQNKHLYLLLSDTGSLSAMLVTDSELPGSSHSYNVNPRLLSDYYSATPSIWNPDENGYYKNNKRIIAVYTEIRYKREHPSCYIPDGSVVTNMSSEAPVLHKLLGTNVLPNWSDRFARNVNVTSSRVLRDLQEDAFQGHFHYRNQFQTIELLYSNNGSYTMLSGNYFPTILYTGSPVTDNVNGTPRTADETRPKNFALMYQIVRG